MRLQYLLLLVATTLLANNVVAVTEDAGHTKLSKATPLDDLAFKSMFATADTAKRSLRAHGPDDEERGFFGKVKIWSWLRKGLNPKQVYKNLGLEGLGQDAWKHPNFEKYLMFSKEWRANQ